jgi:hypothetical protein
LIQLFISIGSGSNEMSFKLDLTYFQGNNVMILLRDGHETYLNYSTLNGRLTCDVLIYLGDIQMRGRFPFRRTARSVSDSLGWLSSR